MKITSPNEGKLGWGGRRPGAGRPRLETGHFQCRLNTKTIEIIRAHGGRSFIEQLVRDYTEKQTQKDS